MAAAYARRVTSLEYAARLALLATTENSAKMAKDACVTSATSVPSARRFVSNFSALGQRIKEGGRINKLNASRLLLLTRQRIVDNKNTSSEETADFGRRPEAYDEI